MLGVHQHSGIATLEKVEEACDRMVFCSVCQRRPSDIYCDKCNTSSESIILNNSLVDDLIYPEQTHPHFEQHHSHNSGCNHTSCSSPRAPGAPGRRRWPAFTSLWLSLLMCVFSSFSQRKGKPCCYPL